MVLAPGCFSILRITAGFPLKDPSPLLMGPPNFTSATCCNNTGEPFRLATTVLFKSSSVLARPMFLINTSDPLLSIKPPVVLRLVSCNALSTSLMDKLYCLNLSEEINTWYCNRSPPMGITWLTPFTLNNLLRMVKSARVLKSAGEVVSLVMAIIMICPMMELMGPICGVIPLGNCTP